MKIISPVVVVFVLIVTACAADLPRNRPSDVSRGTSSLSGSGPDRYKLVGIKQLTPHGGRVDWSPDGQRIVFDSRNTDDFWRLRTMKPDGSDVRDLDCSNVSFPARRHIGQPAWHPSGEWIVMQVEKAHHKHDLFSHSSPGAGFYHDLWVMKVATRECFQLTEVRDGLDANDSRPGGSLHPVFSRLGDRLLWTDLEDGVGLDTGPVGDWRIAIARVTLGAAPTLGPIDDSNPGANGHWYETHGWGPGDASITFAGNTMDQSVLNADINTMPVGAPEAFTRLTATSGKTFTRLTATSGKNGEPGIYDEHAHFTRTDDAFIWMSDGTRRNELWMASPDGSNARQITRFNESENLEFDMVCGLRSNPSDSAWNPVPPPGREQLVVHLGVDYHIPNPTYEQTFLVEFSTDGSTGFDPGPQPQCPPPP